MRTDDPEILQLCTELAQALKASGRMLATAESCTGGLIAACCTSLSGSSDWFERGFVTYSNTAKTEQLGVPATLIEAHGAVSEPVARAMALGALAHSWARASIAVTGVAGPTGGSPEKPVGLVCGGFQRVFRGFLPPADHTLGHGYFFLPKSTVTTLEPSSAPTIGASLCSSPWTEASSSGSTAWNCRPKSTAGSTKAVIAE